MTASIAKHAYFSDTYPEEAQRARLRSNMAMIQSTPPEYGWNSLRERPGYGKVSLKY